MPYVMTRVSPAPRSPRDTVKLFVVTPLTEAPRVAVTEPGTRSHPASSVTVTDGCVAPGMLTAETSGESSDASEPKPPTANVLLLPAPLAMTSSVDWLMPSPTPTAKTSAFACRFAAAVGSPPFALPSVMTTTSWLRDVSSGPRTELARSRPHDMHVVPADCGLPVIAACTLAWLVLRPMTVSATVAKPTTPTRPPWAKRPSPATAVTTLLAKVLSCPNSVESMLPDSSSTSTRSVGVDWVLLSPASVSVTVEVPKRLTEVGLADAPGTGAAEASGAMATPLTVSAAAASTAAADLIRTGTSRRRVAVSTLPPNDGARPELLWPGRRPWPPMSVSDAGPRG